MFHRYSYRVNEERAYKSLIPIDKSIVRRKKLDVDAGLTVRRCRGYAKLHSYRDYRQRSSRRFYGFVPFEHVQEQVGFRRHIDTSVSKSFGCSIQRAWKFVWNLNRAANMQIEGAIKKRYVASRWQFVITRRGSWKFRFFNVSLIVSRLCQFFFVLIEDLLILLAEEICQF